MKIPMTKILKDLLRIPSGSGMDPKWILDELRKHLWRKKIHSRIPKRSWRSWRNVEGSQQDFWSFQKESHESFKNVDGISNEFLKNFQKIPNKKLQNPQRIPNESFKNGERIPNESFKNPQTIPNKTIQNLQRILKELFKKPQRIPKGSIENLPNWSFQILGRCSEAARGIARESLEHLQRLWRREDDPIQLN